ncbi:gamma-glutamylcyclotransferase [Bradyrhizobium valentinum]|uniref:glutathione-specific gamma-glutamylcyclotransferase n=1 Tax=Bradyrhizobium valentinum TaxID=1518501 RepID=A0A0R3LIN6_9BRAD|nr:gamma-glutamylcyclotransferase [Bradyrhizobium valentinum]KRQ88502.1 calcium transporter ChaC [Bradyrhizobium valentinum]KRR07554.1 calcium transporter ChaC [Bradyrhizobium valentinum]
MTADAFIHLPDLRARVTHPEKSLLRLTPEMFSMWEQRARAAGWPAGWRLPDEAIEASRLAVLGDHKAGDDLWIYSYGSLMWDPGFHFAEVRLADVENYQRRFTLKINLGRGSPNHPALMLSLEPGEGCCRGLAFRIAAASVHAESAILWRREMLRGGYAPAMVPMTTPQGPISALAFVSNPAHPSYVGELPLAETAAMIASGKGVLGTNQEYLVQLAMQLDALGIEDPYVAQLHAQIDGGCGA